MSLLIQYLVKLTISLAVVWLFYQFVLRKLTFYNSNRWYLLGYTLLSFFIPFINISSLLKGSSNDIIQYLPSVHYYTEALEEASQCPAPLWSNYDKWDFTALGLMIVAGILLMRFAIRCLSFLRIQRKAKLISGDVFRIYQVDENIIPFSFGNSIFINSNLHTEAELQEIVRHEFVHVRQKHTIDIIWAELLCILNWYNPFAWLLKRSIRQNLEFIADSKVIENGINKKEYQYLLLKVIGNNQFSIATQFNFSSLKKRIVMMNKTKSAKRQIGRFLFLVPVFAIILLAFRKSFNDSTNAKSNMSVIAQADTIPDIKILNSKGYYIDIKDNKGNCMVVVKDKDKKEVKRVLLTEWNAKADYYEDLYGEILSPSIAIIQQKIKANNPDVKSVNVKNNIATVTLKNGKTEVYTLSIKEEKKAFEEKCGIEEVAIATTVASEANIANSVNVATTVNEVNVVNETIADDFEITDKKAVMHLRNGKTEEYDLTNEKEREAFEKKFGKIIKVGTTVPGVYSVVSIAEPALSSTTVSSSNLNEVVTVGKPLTTTVAAESALKEVRVIDHPLNVIEDENIKLIIKNTDKPEDLQSMIDHAKEKGYDLKFTNKNYDNGILTELSGTIKYKDKSSTFSFSEFDQATIIVYIDGDDVSFRMFTGKRRVKS